MSHSESGSPPRTDAIEAFLVDIDGLPSPPALVLQILDYTARPDLSIGVLAELIGRDGALTAKLLRMANSAIYSFPSQITSVERAIMVLGVKAVRLLTLSLSLSALFPIRSEHPDLLLDVRRRSVVSALANRGFLSEIDPSLARRRVPGRTAAFGGSARDRPGGADVVRSPLRRGLAH